MHPGLIRGSAHMPRTASGKGPNENLHVVRSSTGTQRRLCRWCLMVAVVVHTKAYEAWDPPFAANHPMCSLTSDGYGFRYRTNNILHMLVPSDVKVQTAMPCWLHERAGLVLASGASVMPAEFQEFQCLHREDECSCLEGTFMPRIDKIQAMAASAWLGRFRGKALRQGKWQPCH
jgi:hypothetical protein